MKIPIRYLPNSLSKKDKDKQLKMLKKSRKLYKKKDFYTRKKLPSFHNKVSPHIMKAQKIYKTDRIILNTYLSKATGCSMNALNKIVKKGEGAYFSSGSRPNQSAQSWGLARLASSITGGKAAAVDYNILEEGCNHKKKAFKMAVSAKKKYGYGHGSTRKTNIK